MRDERQPGGVFFVCACGQTETITFQTPLQTADMLAVLRRQYSTCPVCHADVQWQERKASGEKQDV